ncbi:MAG: glycoside hydrolase family 2, partial [Clostridia bacterium]|nr:glycoside hydrolase family 2 [Clostridia bacterium]
GLIVWQDFVNGGGAYQWSHIALFPFLGAKHKDSDYRYFARENEGGRYEFIASAKATVQVLKNAPCVGVWVPFNEGWGQFDSEQVTRMIEEWDGTRPIDSCSGWHDQGKHVTTMRSMHTYYTPLRVPADPRAVVLSEFGGYSKKTDGHVFSQKEFGYKIFKTDEALWSALKTLYLRKLKPLIKKGLCACVYTQVSDVEEEINGLVTYDRAVIKVPVSVMKAINDEIKAEAETV